MKITYHKNIPSIDHDGSPFNIDGIEFLITGTHKSEEDGKYYVEVKNLKENKRSTIEHGRFCEIIEIRGVRP